MTDTKSGAGGSSIEQRHTEVVRCISNEQGRGNNDKARGGAKFELSTRPVVQGRRTETTRGAVQKPRVRQREEYNIQAQMKKRRKEKNGPGKDEDEVKGRRTTRLTSMLGI